jgi:hypothetical protein
MITPYSSARAKLPVLIWKREFRLCLKLPVSDEQLNAPPAVVSILSFALGDDLYSVADD